MKLSNYVVKICLKRPSHLIFVIWLTCNLNLSLSRLMCFDGRTCILDVLPLRVYSISLCVYGNSVASSPPSVYLLQHSRRDPIVSFCRLGRGWVSAAFGHCCTGRFAAMEGGEMRLLPTLQLYRTQFFTNYLLWDVQKKSKSIETFYTLM